MKRKILLLLLLSCFILSGCIKQEVGDISNVKTNISSLNEHNKNDIEKTFKIIKKEFHTKGFKDCQLLNLDYTDKYVDREKELLISNKNAKDAIVITFKFKTGNNPSQVFNPNEEYEYTAEFIKNDKSAMVKTNWGQG